MTKGRIGMVARMTATGSRGTGAQRAAWPGSGVARAAFLAAAMVAMLAALVAGCGRPPAEQPPPPPLEVSDEATGHYCGMLLVDHEGPKGQIHLRSRPEPVWFSSVRDTIAFLRLPEEPRDIAAVYVNDMARTTSWEAPGPGAWVEARQAWFVIGSDRAGGMGAPEAVPFSDRAAADAFRERHGGRVVRLDEIPDAYVLGSPDLPASAPARTSPSADAVPAAAPQGDRTPVPHAGRTPAADAGRPSASDGANAPAPPASPAR